MTTSDRRRVGEQTPGPEQMLDWEEARRFLRRRIATHLHSDERSILEDLTQVALVRLLRAIRREGVRDAGALMTEIARRTWIDHVRSKRRREHIWLRLEDGHDQVRDPRPGHDAPGELIDRVRFVVLEFFDARRSGCRDLAGAFFAGVSWAEVARQTGRSPEAVRQQWLRCCDALRAFAPHCPDLLHARTRLQEEET
jgi:DNA-directed RNA polymerase specialized sigma24 family protein